MQASDPDQYGTPFDAVPNARDVNMYQVHLRIFGPNGNFQSVIDRLDDIQELGINVIYLMPIYPHGEDDASTTSPYCIKDYTDIAEEYGDLSDLRELVDGAHERDMAVILDIAINGTSWDHSWITDHPDYYTGDQLGSYSDVAELDLDNSDTRDAIIESMRYWIFNANIDGYRCDYANNPPIDFWKEVNENLRGISTHDLLLFAEGDETDLFNADFDMIFGTYWFYNALAGVANGGSVNDLFETINSSEYTNASSDQQVVRFTGNHDTYTNDYYEVAGGARPFELFNNHKGVIANLLVSGYMKGVPFLMSGQEVDYDTYTPWPWSDESLDIDWSENTSSIDDFAKILNFRLESDVIRRGTLTDYSDDNVCAFIKEYGGKKIFVMVNMRNSSQTYTIPSAVAGIYTGVFSGNTETLTSGKSWSLSAYKYYVLSYNGDDDSEEGMTIHAYDYNSVYFWNTSDGSTTTWPGEDMTSEGDSWYSYTFSNAISANVIFSNEGSDQTDDLSREGDGWYYDGSWYDSKPSFGMTVHAYDYTSIYFWNTSDGTTTSWPGEDMTSEGDGWYYYTFSNATSSNVIFSNEGSDQTDDLSREGDGWYYDGTWYDSEPATVAENAKSASSTVNEWQEAYSSNEPLNSLKIFPNPTEDGLINMVLPAEYKSAIVYLINIQGKIIFEENISDYKNTLDLSSITRGLYFLKVKTDTKTYTQKIVIK